MIKSILLSVIALLLGEIAIAEPASAPAPAPNGSETAILKERLEVLRKIVEIAKVRHQNGGGGLEDVLRAELEVSEAELDLSPTAEERLKVLTAIVDLHRQLEKRLNEAAKLGDRDVISALRAKVNRLKAESVLERAKAEANSNSKK